MKRLVNLILVVWSFSPAFGSARYDVTHLAWSPPLLRSTSLILLGGETFTVPVHGFSQIVFHDTEPQANWSHPAFFEFIFPSGEKKKFPVELPPLDYQWKTSLPAVSQPEQPQYTIENLDNRLRSDTPNRLWALLINGYAERRHWNDFSFLLRVLKTVYGFPPEQILILDDVYQKRDPDMDRDGVPDILYGSTRGDIARAIDHLREQMKESDRLLIVLNTHGERKNGESTLVLPESELTASEFAQELDRLPKARTTVILGQCYAGGFIRPLRADHRIVVAAAMDNEISWARRIPQFEEFLYHWISAIGGQDHLGNPVPVDRNNDSQITLHEAFSFALSHDESPESPAMEAPKNSGFARKWTLVN